MTRMTLELLVKCTGQAKRKREETQEQYLKRITHLYCAEKGIEKIEGLSLCRCLTVLYLYDNFISTIENLDGCTLLTHLYLQNNTITQICNLVALRRLTKLYLDYNAITVIEGLESMDNLTELYISHQALPDGEKLLFDPRSISAIANSLCVLNVSGNRLDSIKELSCLTNITYFSACDNRLQSMKDINRVFSHWHALIKLELSGNPLCHKHKYRDRVITMGSSILNLDGREITETERTFLLKWKEMRKARHRQQKKSYLLTSDTTVEGSSHAVCPHKNSKKFMSVHPLTMPALPARQLPRKSKGRPPANQELPYGTLTLADKSTDHEAIAALTSTWTRETENMSPDEAGKVSKYDHDLKIQAGDTQICAQKYEKQNKTDVVGRKMNNIEDVKLPEILPRQSLIAQSGNLVSSLKSDHLQRKLWQASQKIPAKVFE